MVVTLTGLIGVFSLTQSCSRNTCADHGFLSFCKSKENYFNGNQLFNRYRVVLTSVVLPVLRDFVSLLHLKWSCLMQVAMIFLQHSILVRNFVLLTHWFELDWFVYFSFMHCLMNVYLLVSTEEFFKPLQGFQ